LPSSFCTYFNANRCGSCQWIEKDYGRQIREKEERIRAKLGLAEDFRMESPALSASEGFRNRAKMTVTGTASDPVIGLPGASTTDLGRLDEGRELLDCPIHHPKLNELFNLVKAFITRFGIVPYRMGERRGELKGLIAFYSPDSQEMYLRFVLRSRASVRAIEKMLPELQRSLPELTCISVNLQPIPHAILEGAEEIILTERKWIRHRLGPVELKLAPQAFVQTHVEGATRLYETAARWIAEAGTPAHPVERMLELFCGQGAFSFFAQASVQNVLGIEINADAIRAAQETAQERGFRHLRFKVADAMRVAEEIAEFAPDLILVNPPRRGLGGGVELIAKAAPPNFIYSSCSIETLAQDLKVLRAQIPAYRVKKVQLFDFFPHTAHFETLVELEKAR
jgi:23S rRNA (uracil747-C5)-methyltransferase